MLTDIPPTYTPLGPAAALPVCSHLAHLALPIGHALGFSLRSETGVKPSSSQSSRVAAPRHAPVVNHLQPPSLRLRLRPGAEVGARGRWNAESGGRCSQWEAALASGWEAGPTRVLG